VTESVALDVAISWTGAAGCLLYLWTLYRHGRQGVAAQRLLLALLAALLLVRGFDWMSGSPALGRLTFALASGLPLAITLFVERVLRRHAPLWVKWLVLGIILIVPAAGVFSGRSQFGALLTVFATCFAFVVLLNGGLLLTRDRATLSTGENHLATTLVLLAFLSAPLVITDFRTMLGFPAVRLGAIAALLFTYSMSGAALRSASAGVWAGRYLLLLGCALVLAGLFAVALQAHSLELWWTTTLGATPLAYAWILLTMVAVNAHALSTESDTSAFLRWLTEVSLASPEALFTALGGAPDSKTHLLLRQADLADYDVQALAAFSDAQLAVASLARVRQLSGRDGPTREGSEQWLDLLERTQMTHGFVARRVPPAVFLVNLPAAASSVAAEMRLKVMRHLSQQLDLHMT
jgi:hypothetical protein